MSLERALGEHANLYKLGLACEGESFGIGAFAYYRRIVEQLIDGFVEAKAKRLPEEERADFRAKVIEARHNSPKDILALVKEEIPAGAVPDGTNPLAFLYGKFSAGIHSKTDEQCMAEVESLRDVLEGFVDQLEGERKAKTYATLVHSVTNRETSE